jgi:hypothetical protein
VTSHPFSRGGGEEGDERERKIYEVMATISSNQLEKFVLRISIFCYFISYQWLIKACW